MQQFVMHPTLIAGQQKCFTFENTDAAKKYDNDPAIFYKT
jgi:hypothetical protein